MAGVALPQAPDALLQAETLFSQSVCSSTYSLLHGPIVCFFTCNYLFCCPSCGQRGMPQLGDKGREWDLPPVFSFK